MKGEGNIAFMWWSLLVTLNQPENQSEGQWNSNVLSKFGLDKQVDLFLKSSLQEERSLSKVT